MRLKPHARHRMRHARHRIRLKPLAPIAAALVVGAAIGFGGASLAGNDNPLLREEHADTSTQGSQPGGAPALPGSSGVNVQIVSAILHPAGTARGRRRKRARLNVHMRLTNNSASTFTLGRVRLQLGSTLLDIDPLARKVAAPLLRPLPASATADGVLRYETGGADTQRLISKQLAALRVAGRIVLTKVTVGTVVHRPR